MSLMYVPVAPGVDTSIPTGTQVSAKYTLTGPDGTRAVFNDPADRDYVGVIGEITGLDSPEVRESAEDLVQMDGGIHGDFFYGRRPITLTGLLINPASADDRNRRMTRLQRASNAMRADATLSWVLEGGHEQFVRVRRQQPLRFQGGWQKEFQLAVVAADPRIYGADFKQSYVTAGGVAGESGRGYDRGYDVDYGGGAVVGSVTSTNLGNFLTYPVLAVYGPGSNPEITNFTTGETIRILYTLAAGEYLVIDTLNRTVMLNNQSSRYSAVDFLSSDWWGLVPGDNEIRQAWSSYGTEASLVVQWRDAWL